MWKGSPKAARTASPGLSPLAGTRADLQDGGSNSMLQFDLFRSFDPQTIAAGFWSNSVPNAQPERNMGEAAYLLAGSQLGTSGANTAVEHENALFAVESGATTPLTAPERIQLWDSIGADLDGKTLGAWMPSEMIQDPNFTLVLQQPQLMAWPIVPQFPAQMVAQALTVTSVDQFNQPAVSVVTSGPLTITVKNASGTVVLGPIPTDFAQTFDTANPYNLNLQSQVPQGTYTVNVDAAINGTTLHQHFAVANIPSSLIGAQNGNLSFPGQYLVAVDSAGNANGGSLQVTRGSVVPGSAMQGFVIVNPDSTGTFDVTGPSGTQHTYTAPTPWARFIPVD